MTLEKAAHRWRTYVRRWGYGRPYEHKLFCQTLGLSKAVNRPHPNDATYWAPDLVREWRAQDRKRRRS